MKKIFDTVSLCMKPVIPLTMASGILKLLIVLLGYTGIFATHPQAEEILLLISDSAFYFLPVYVAYASAKHFEVNPLHAMVSTATLLLPDFINLMDASDKVSFFIFPVYQTSYAYSVLPIILLTYIMKKLTVLLDKVPSNVFRSSFLPVSAITLTSLIGILFVCPIGAILGGFLSEGIQFLQTQNPILAWAVFAGILPALLVTGTHWIFMAIVFESFGRYGMEPGYMVSFFICNMGLVGTCLAVFLREKSDPNRSNTLSYALITLFSGTSEPPLYGVCVAKKYPFLSLLLGCFLGGVYQGIFTPISVVYAFPSVFTTLMFLPKDNFMNFIHAIVAALIGFGASFIITLLWKRPALEKAVS